ncbi:hypothetical protein ACEF17_10590, partial [Streptococcus hyovaginalis]
IYSEAFNSEEDSIINELIVSLVQTIMEARNMRNLINRDGWTVKGKYCSMPNKLLPYYQKHLNLVDSKIKDLFKLTAINNAENIVEIANAQQLMEWIK